MEDERGIGILKIPILLVGLAMCLWIIWYLLETWPSLTGQELPWPGYLIVGASAIIFIIISIDILWSMFKV